MTGPETDLLLKEFHDAGIYLPGELAGPLDSQDVEAAHNGFLESMTQGFEILAAHRAAVLKPTKGSTHELR